MPEEKKTTMTIEEVLERLKEILRANGWNGADFFMEMIFEDNRNSLDRYEFVKGFLYAMNFGGILNKNERSSLTKALIENEFWKSGSIVSDKKGGGSG